MMLGRPDEGSRRRRPLHHVPARVHVSFYMKLRVHRDLGIFIIIFPELQQPEFC